MKSQELRPYGSGSEDSPTVRLPKRCRVLIADDSPDNTEMLRQSIQDDDFEVDCARDGVETLDRIALKLPDVVLLDMMMPRLDGLAVLKRLRSAEATRDLKVVVVSARSQFEDVVQALSLGANDYLTKPFHPEVVRARVRNQYQTKMATDELKRLSKLKDEFLSIVTHDLQSPVSTIISYCSLLLDEAEGVLPDTTQTRIHRVHKNALFLHELIGDLLDVVQIEAGRMKLDCGLTHVAEAIDEAVERNRFAAAGKNIEIAVQPGPVIPALFADSIKIQRVLNNLLSNAIKFSAAGAQVTVKSSFSGGGVQVDVIDTGQGIPEQEQKQLFKKFGRTSVRATSGEKSTGLGLLIVKKIIDLHGGAIRVQSQEGQGSTFSIFLPLVPPVNR